MVAVVKDRPWGPSQFLVGIGAVGIGAVEFLQE